MANSDTQVTPSKVSEVLQPHLLQRQTEKLEELDTRLSSMELQMISSISRVPSSDDVSTTHPVSQSTSSTNMSGSHNNDTTPLSMAAIVANSDAQVTPGSKVLEVLQHLLQRQTEKLEKHWEKLDARLSNMEPPIISSWGVPSSDDVSTTYPVSQSSSLASMSDSHDNDTPPLMMQDCDFSKVSEVTVLHLLQQRTEKLEKLWEKLDARLSSMETMISSISRVPSEVLQQRKTEKLIEEKLDARLSSMEAMISNISRVPSSDDVSTLYPVLSKNYQAME